MRRLNGENLLPFILAEDFFDSEKRRYEVAIGSECPASAQNNQKKKIEKEKRSPREVLGSRNPAPAYIRNDK